MDIISTILMTIGILAIGLTIEYAVFKIALYISDKRDEKRRKEAELEMLLRKLKKDENN